MPGDTIILSSNPIPGNEEAVSNIINELSEKGANVIFQDTHVSGHACQEELKLIYSLVKPKYAIPVHGEYRHLKANAGIAKSLGIPKDNIFILKSGDVLALDDESAEVVDKVHTGEILVDGLGVGDVGNIEEARKVVTEAVEKCLMSRHADWSKIKLVIRDTMNDFIWKRTKRKPMILPIIMDV